MKGYHTLQGFVDGDEDSDFEPRFAYHATLRIYSEAGLDFEKITATLGVSPTKVARRGERVGPRSPPNKGDIWLYQAPVAEDEELHHHIDALWAAIRPQAAFLRDLKTEARVEVFLGYSSNVDHAGICIPYKSLEMFAALELELGLNIIVAADE